MRVVLVKSCGDESSSAALSRLLCPALQGRELAQTVCSGRQGLGPSGSQWQSKTSLGRGCIQRAGVLDWEIPGRPVISH